MCPSVPEFAVIQTPEYITNITNAYKKRLCSANKYAGHEHADRNVGLDDGTALRGNGTTESQAFTGGADFGSYGLAICVMRCKRSRKDSNQSNTHTHTQTRAFRGRNASNIMFFPFDM